MKDKFKKLIDVKSIVTILFTLLVGYLAIIDVINGEQIMTTYATIIAFYFGTQSNKKGAIEDDRTQSAKSNDT